MIPEPPEGGPGSPYALGSAVPEGAAEVSEPGIIIQRSRKHDRKQRYDRLHG